MGGDSAPDYWIDGFSVVQLPYYYYCTYLLIHKLLLCHIFLPNANWLLVPAPTEHNTHHSSVTLVKKVIRHIFAIL